MTIKLADVKPLHDFVVMSPFEALTDSLIAVPKNAQPQSDQMYEVHAVGPGQLLQDGSRADMLVKPGDIIVIAGSANGAFLNADGKKLLVTSQEFVVAKVGHIGTMIRKPDESVLSVLS